MTIVFTDQSIAQSQVIAFYILNHFTRRELERYYKLLTKFEKKVTIFPEMYPQNGKDKNLRRAVLSKQLSVFYRISSTKITVLSILDNRMSPERWP